MDYKIVSESTGQCISILAECGYTSAEKEEEDKAGGRQEGGKLTKSAGVLTSM